MGFVANGNTAPNELRDKLAAAMALAANTS
jgi:hypothetical protein